MASKQKEQIYLLLKVCRWILYNRTRTGTEEEFWYLKGLISEIDRHINDPGLTRENPRLVRRPLESL